MDLQAFNPSVSSTSTLEIERQMYDKPVLSPWEMFKANWTLHDTEGAANLTHLVGDWAASLVDHNYNSKMISPDEADELYPTGERWQNPVLEIDAKRAHASYTKKMEYEKLLANLRSDGRLGDFYGFMGAAISGMVHDPVYALGIMGASAAIGAATGGMGVMTAYGALDFMGAGVMRSMAAKALSEGVTSVAMDIPLSLLSQKLINSADYVGYKMTNEDVIGMIAGGAVFAGAVGGLAGALGHTKIAKDFNLITKGKALDADAAHMNMKVTQDMATESVLKNHPSVEGTNLANHLYDEGIYVVGKDGGFYTAEEAAKVLHAGDVAQVVDAKGIKRLRVTDLVDKMGVSFKNSIPAELKPSLIKMIKKIGLKNIMNDVNLDLLDPDIVKMIKATLKEMEKEGAAIIDNHLIGEIPKEYKPNFVLLDSHEDPNWVYYNEAIAKAKNELRMLEGPEQPLQLDYDPQVKSVMYDGSIETPERGYFIDGNGKRHPIYARNGAKTNYDTPVQKALRIKEVSETLGRLAQRYDEARVHTLDKAVKSLDPLWVHEFPLKHPVAREIIEGVNAAHLIEQTEKIVSSMEHVDLRTTRITNLAEGVMRKFSYTKAGEPRINAKASSYAGLEGMTKTAKDIEGLKVKEAEIKAEVDSTKKAVKAVRYMDNYLKKGMKIADTMAELNKDVAKLKELDKLSVDDLHKLLEGLNDICER